MLVKAIGDVYLKIRKGVAALGFVVLPTADSPETTSPTLTAGAGVPTATEPNGSVYLRSNGTSSTTVYVRASGAWSAVGALDTSLGDDTALTFGDGSEATVEYDEDGTDSLRWTGAPQTFADGVSQTFEGAGGSTGDVVLRYGGSQTEGWERRVYEATVSPTAVETNVLNVPAGSVIESVQTNVEVLLVAGGTSVTLSIGTSADPDKYGTHGSDSLAQNQKIDTLPTPAVLSSAEQLVLTAAASGGASDGDTAFSAGSVRVRIVYRTLNSLDDA